MNRTEKETTVQALHEKLAKATFVAAVSFTKLDANTAIELRKAMRAAKVDYKVVKNTLAKKAAKGTPAEKLDAQFEGPVAVAIGYDDMIVSAKSITEFFKKAPEGTLKIKAAVADNAALDAAGVEALAKMPGLPETRATLLALISTPATTLVRLFSTPASQLARVVQAHSEGGEKQQAA